MVHESVAQRAPMHHGPPSNSVSCLTKTQQRGSVGNAMKNWRREAICFYISTPLLGRTGSGNSRSPSCARRLISIVREIAVIGVSLERRITREAISTS